MTDFFLFTTYFQIARELFAVGFCLKTRKNGEVRTVASNGKTEALAPVNLFFRFWCL